MTAIARPRRNRRRSAGPVAIALLLAVAGFVLALSIGAALQSSAEPTASSTSENAAVGGSPAPASVQEHSAGGASRTTAAKLSTVPALPALHGVKAKARKKASSRKAAPRTATATTPTPVTRVAPAPTVAPQRTTPVAPRQTYTPKAPAKKNPGFVGKDFDSSG